MSAEKPDSNLLTGVGFWGGDLTDYTVLLLREELHSWIHDYRVVTQ